MFYFLRQWKQNRLFRHQSEFFGGKTTISEQAMALIPFRYVDFFWFIFWFFFTRSGADFFIITVAYILVIWVMFVQVKMKSEDSKMMRNGASEERWTQSRCLKCFEGQSFLEFFSSSILISWLFIWFDLIWLGEDKTFSWIFFPRPFWILDFFSSSMFFPHPR